MYPETNEAAPPQGCLRLLIMLVLLGWLLFQHEPMAGSHPDPLDPYL
jgi:hypothetical protein